MQNIKYKEFNAGRAGSGSINLSTGNLTFVHEDTVSNANILPIKISHVYSSARAADTSNKEVTYGKGFKLNLQQTLKRNNPDNVNDTQYTYTDASGTEHKFEEKYYYLSEEKNKIYVSDLSGIMIDVDGKLTYYTGGITYDIFTQQITESGLTLQSELKAFNGSKKLETRHEEVVQLTEEIFQLDKSITDLEYSIKQYGKQDTNEYQAMLNLQRTIEANSIAIPLNEINDKETSLGVGQTLSDKEKLEKALLTDQESLRNKKNSYDDKEREELKQRYNYLKEIALTEIQKYKNLKGNKEDVLKKLNEQIPVNYIIDKNNQTLGFNADGNLVALFDNYGNQAAIVYENSVIIKVVDADSREIVFEYYKKNSVKGQLKFITDYKGHKTTLSYETGKLKKIEYPNGDTTVFTYTQEGLLIEMLSPSKIGIQLQYNTDKKVVSIAELTNAHKIDKRSVTEGEIVADKIADLTYEDTTTIVRDIKIGVTESNMFDADGKLLRVKTMENDKLIGFTAFDESSVNAAGKRCNFVMTTDNITVNGISDIDLLHLEDVNPVMYNGTIGAKKIWTADLTKLDSNQTEFFLCGSATATSAEITPLRQKTEYCNKYDDHDMSSNLRRLEYKVLVDYASETPLASADDYKPIETGDNIDTLYLNNMFVDLHPMLKTPTIFSPTTLSLQSFFGYYKIHKATNYYPIIGNGDFDVNDLSKQVYFTAKDYPLDGGVKFGCALWAEDVLLWCNQLYAENNSGVTAGWQQTEVNLSEWGPITVHYRAYMFNWAQFLSKEQGKFLQKYKENSYIDEFVAGFDYRIKDQQHIAIPITLRKVNGKPKSPKQISVFAYYLQNRGEAVFEKPILIKGKTAYTLLDELDNPLIKSTSEDILVENDQVGGFLTVKSNVSTKYNDNNLPTEKRTVYTYTAKNGASEQTAVEKWFYNPQGRVIEHWNYVQGEELASGIDITETVYDQRGNAVKSFAYNSLDASTKFYQEQERTENGRVLADIDETGVNKTSYDYDDVTGEVKTATAANGSKFSYAHDTNTDDVTAITLSTEDGEANCTNRTYTAGYLTELKSGGNTVNFEYDKKGRTSAVYLNGEKPYVKYEYQEDSSGAQTIETLTATIAPADSALSYTVITESDKKGNLLKVREGRESLLFSDSIVNTYYTEEDKKREGLLKTSVDKTTDTITEYTYNSLRQPLSVVDSNSVTGSIISNETMEYNEYGQLAKRKIVSGGNTQEYGFHYKDNFAKELQSLDMPYGLSSSQSMDLNGRIKECILTVSGAPLMSQCFYYRKHGDHGTSQISSVRYGERRNGRFVIKDGLSYSYDESGNISVIKENGKLSVRYGYDKLNRLIREDNVQFGKTTLFTYDNNGNILSKRETPFTLRAMENIVSFTNEKEYGYDAKHPDRLAVYGNEVISQYDVIGNPTVYRGKDLTWRKGRRLASIYVRAENETLTFKYDASGRRIEKVSKGEPIKYVYNGDMLIREAPINENNMIYLENDFITGDNSIDGDGVVIDSNKYVLEYIYGQEGVAGLICNGTKYYYRRNINGDISRIYALDGTLKACYTYDAWGNHKVYDASGNVNTNPNFIGNVNPFRYRGYYFDRETGLYYCKSRYYDPEVGRWINADDIAYLDPETINGLNLYAYCGNNPVMYIDPNGHFLIGFLVGLGLAALIGAGVGAAAYTVSEVISSAVTGEWNWSWGMLGGAVLGGAIGGAVSFVLPGIGITGVVGIIVSAGVTGLTSTAIGMGLQNKWEGTNHSSASIMGTSLLFGGISALTAGLTSKIKILGFTGRGSISQVARQISTKFYNGTIRRITAKTFVKMVAYEAAYSVFNVFADVLINTYSHYSRTPSWGK